MRTNWQNPQILFGWVLLLGTLLGLWFSLQIGSYTVGVPMGITLSLLVAKVTHRMGVGIRRFRR